MADFSIYHRSAKSSTPLQLLAPPPKTHQRKTFKKKETRITNRESAKQILIGQ
jgi:hypothetical protein